MCLSFGDTLDLFPSPTDSAHVHVIDKSCAAVASLPYQFNWSVYFAKATGKREKGKGAIMPSPCPSFVI